MVERLPSIQVPVFELRPSRPSLSARTCLDPRGQGAGFLLSVTAKRLREGEEQQRYVLVTNNSGLQLYPTPDSKFNALLLGHGSSF